MTDKHWPESELFPEPPSGDELQQIQDAVEQAKAADAIILCLGDSECDHRRIARAAPVWICRAIKPIWSKALMKTGKPVVAVLLTGKPASINWINRYVPAILEAWIPGEAGGTAIAEAIVWRLQSRRQTVGDFPENRRANPVQFSVQARQPSEPEQKGRPKWLWRFDGRGRAVSVRFRFELHQVRLRQI